MNKLKTEKYDFSEKQKSLIRKGYVLVRHKGNIKRAYIDNKEDDKIFVLIDEYLKKWIKESTIMANTAIELNVQDVVGCYNGNLNFIWRD
jgi:hypothetical protein